MIKNTYSTYKTWFMFMCSISLMSMLKGLDPVAFTRISQAPTKISFTDDNDVLLHEGTLCTSYRWDVLKNELTAGKQQSSAAAAKAEQIVIRINNSQNAAQRLYTLNVSPATVAIEKINDNLNNKLIAQNKERGLLAIANLSIDNKNIIELYQQSAKGMDLIGASATTEEIPTALALNKDATLLAVATQSTLLLFSTAIPDACLYNSQSSHSDIYIEAYSSNIHRAPVTFNPLVNDCGEGLSVIAVTTPAHGSASFTATNITYTPQTNFSGSDSFTYTVSDGVSTSLGTINVTITPTATGETITVVKGGSLTFNAVVNDCGSNLRVNMIVTQPTNGTATSNPGSTDITYTSSGSNVPNTDSFTYNVIDGEGNVSNTATVLVNLVDCVPFNQLFPVGVPVATQNAPANLTFAPNGTVAAVVNTGSGTVTGYSVDPVTGFVTAQNSVAVNQIQPYLAYHPASNILAIAGNSSTVPTISTLSVAANGALMLLQTYTVTGALTNENILGLQFITVGGNTFLVALRPDNDSVTTYTVNTATGAVTRIDDVGLSAPLNGAAFAVGPTIAGQGQIAIGVQRAFPTADVLRCQIDSAGNIPNIAQTVSGFSAVQFLDMEYSSDGLCLAVTGIINFATPTLFLLSVNQTTGVLTLVSNITTVANPTSLSISPSGKQLFVSNNQVGGPINLYILDTATATATLSSTYQTVGAQPTSVDVEQSGNFVGATFAGTPGFIQIYGFGRALPVSRTTTCNVPVTFDPTTGCANYTITNVTTPVPSGAASFVNIPTPSITYTPAPGFSGIATFDYTLSDGTNSSIATATITVNPTAGGATQTFTCSQAATIIPTTDCGSATLTKTIVLPATIGTATVVGNQLQYQPNMGASGTDSFTYTVTDPTSLVSAPAIVSITINPTAAGASATVTCSSVNNIIAPIDCGTGLTRTLVDTSNAQGTVTINGSGEFVYTPTPGYSKNASFTYTVTDASGNTSAPATVTIVVTPVAVADTVTTTATC